MRSFILLQAFSHVISHTVLQQLGLTITVVREMTVLWTVIINCHMDKIKHKKISAGTVCTVQ